MRHDINEDWIEFFTLKDSSYVQERYHEYIIRMLKKEREENGKS